MSSKTKEQSDMYMTLVEKAEASIQNLETYIPCSYTFLGCKTSLICRYNKLIGKFTPVKNGDCIQVWEGCEWVSRILCYPCLTKLAMHKILVRSKYLINDLIDNWVMPCRIIHLTQDMFTLVDRSDYTYLIQNKWRYNHGYAHRSTRDEKGSRKETHHIMHRVIYEKNYGCIPLECHIHHINGYKLDNRLCNLKCMSRDDHCRTHTSDIGHDTDEPNVWRENGLFRYWKDGECSRGYHTSAIAIQEYFQKELFGHIVY